VDAVVLSGASAFGLAAADGVMGWLAVRQRGLAFGGARVPIVAGAAASPDGPCYSAFSPAS
jgi:L-aminopeptidase/D-esterase-like protein